MTGGPLVKVTGGPVLTAIVGPTATGKSDIAVDVATALHARGLPAEIVSCDSMAVYRGLDVCAAKPSAEQRRAVAHHLLDVADPSEDFTAVRFRDLAREAVSAIHARRALPIVVGGSGLYFRALVDDLEFAPTDDEVRRRLQGQDPAELYRRLQDADPAMAARLDPRNVRRVVRAAEILELTGRPPSDRRNTWDRFAGPYELCGIALTRSRQVLVDRAGTRLQAMLEAGLVEEVRRAREGGLSRTASQAVGVKEILRYLGAEISLEEAGALYTRNVRRFIARQTSWFRADPRLHWIDVDEAGGPAEVAAVLVARFAAAAAS